MLKSNLKKIWN